MLLNFIPTQHITYFHTYIYILFIEKILVTANKIEQSYLTIETKAFLQTNNIHKKIF
jgi:hypothetical protein